MGLVISAHEPASRVLSGTQPDWPALERRSKFAAALLIVGAVVDSMSVAASFLQVQFLTRIRDEADRFEGQIALGFLGNIAARAVWRAEEMPQVIVATWLSIAADAVSVPAAILAAFLVRRVSSGLPKTLGTADATIGTHATGSVQPV